MVRGIESFKTWFRGYEEQYVIIGGTACDLLMMDEGLDFRATKDIDLVLIVEAMNEVFGRRFWEYVSTAGYEHRNKSTGKQQFYRFMVPKSREYPVMIELFTRKPDAIILPKDAVLSPLPGQIRSKPLKDFDDNEIYNFLDAYEQDDGISGWDWDKLGSWSTYKIIGKDVGSHQVTYKIEFDGERTRDINCYFDPTDGTWEISTQWWP